MTSKKKTTKTSKNKTPKPAQGFYSIEKPVSLAEMTGTMIGGAFGAIVGLMWIRQPRLFDDAIKSVVGILPTILSATGPISIPFGAAFDDKDPVGKTSPGMPPSPFDFMQPTRRPQRRRSRSKKTPPPSAPPVA